MQLDEATQQAHEGYLNHVLACSSCYPPTKRYCLCGSELHDRYLAQYLMSLDLHARRTYLARLEAVNPARCEALKVLLLEINEREKST
ncbi:hypothetical protein [Pseudomonas sp. TWP3-2]|uniref:hypothetical protein n=1 Tax=Pseudomonas sp. TWP3-2 TaxID=2804574 RepID=UPI003CFAC4B5